MPRRRKELLPAASDDAAQQQSASIQNAKRLLPLLLTGSHRALSPLLPSSVPTLTGFYPVFTGFYRVYRAINRVGFRIFLRSTWVNRVFLGLSIPLLTFFPTQYFAQFYSFYWVYESLADFFSTLTVLDLVSSSFTEFMEPFNGFCFEISYGLPSST